MKPDCKHKDLYTNKKSYSNHKRTCIGNYVHPFWKGEDASYKSKHEWVRKYLPKPDICKRCNKKEPKEVANLDGKYSRDLSTWEWMCVSCHRWLDGQITNFIEWRKNNTPPPPWKGKKLSEEHKKNISVGVLKSFERRI